MIPVGQPAFRPHPGASSPGRWHPAASLGAAVLTVVSALLLPAAGVAALLGLESFLLGRAGLRWRRLPLMLRPWLGLVALVLLVHAVTAADAAPLGRPSWVGLGRGVVALLRIAAMAAAIALLRRALALPDLVAGLGVWVRPLRPLGVDAAQLGLVLAVAFGAAPRVLDEGRRAEAALRLRRAGTAEQPSSRRGRQRWRDRAAVVVPALESLLRRAETMPLALVGRVPSSAGAALPLPWPQGVGLLVWAALLVVVAW
jgi:energy-coupling factor transporter transmembrane protein EcfT